jgi:hypoxia up-regulated 1
MNMFATEFNSMKERKGKPDIRENKRAVVRMLKDAIKAKEVLSANKMYGVKIGELADSVTLKYTVKRTDFEANSASFFDAVTGPIDMALKNAGLEISDIDQVELLGGGIRVPKIHELLQKRL